MEDYEKHGSLHEMFIQQAKKSPDKLAVVMSNGTKLTYRELDEMTDLIATALIVRGVLKGDIVGIYMERCLDYVLAYISILKAGAAYLPIEATYPEALLQELLKDSKPAAIFTHPDLAKNLSGDRNVIVCEVEWFKGIQAEVETLDTRPICPSVAIDDLAYTVYSSGTTGKPKGIQCPHRGAVFSYLWRSQLYPYGSDEHEACNVFFVWEMLRPLLKGATLYVIPDNTIYDPHALCQYLHHHQITRMLFTPSLLEAVLDAEGLDLTNLLSSIRTLIFCGEVVTCALLERCMKALPRVQFLNLYSISEAHDIACADLTKWYLTEKDNLKNRKFCPVGKLLPGVHVVILNEQLQPQPVGVPGEIYIGGPTLAIGYLNRPELNRSRFIDCPPEVNRKVGSRLYKAGDWGYVLSDGSLEICGRCDSMVKIRGYSIETQAVESALLEMTMVNACVVLTVGEEGEDKQLVAYIVPEGRTNKKEIRSLLKKRLPFYMIPSHFIFLNSIPILASSGKLNKKALPDVKVTKQDDDEEGRPTTDKERELEPIWAEVLQLKRVDVQESFFDLGGHSLLATKLLNKVNEIFKKDLTVKDLLIYSTISAMAKLLDDDTNDSPNRRMSLLPKLDLKREVETNAMTVVLDMDIQLRAFWRSMRVRDKWHRGRVLLTGATGFLGSFLLRDLLQSTHCEVFLIVREQLDVSGIDRVKMTLRQYGIIHDDDAKADEQNLNKQLMKRVTIFTGDVALRNMGLSEDDHAYLCTEIDYIIHAAATVNLIYPYRALRSPNVHGTQNVIKFACTSKIKPIHYISTDAVFPNGLTDCHEEADMFQYADQLEDGYSQSKWVAERLVQRAMERGLPAVIYRLGNLSGETEQAYWNPQDFNLLMIQGCIQLGCAPDVDWDVEMTPVNFVSSLVVALAQKKALALGKVFHVINTQPLKSSWLYEWMSAHGYPIEVVPFCQWKDLVIAQQKRVKNGELLVRLLDVMIRDETFFSRLSHYRRTTLDSVLNTLDLKYPEINSDLLKKYFYHLTERRLIRRTRRNTLMDRPLEGMVAIVTGASSGIGAAISQQMARAGAHVTMAARRADKLDELKRTILKDGGIAIAVKCDVTDREQVENMVRHTECTLGPVDILVNNAGVMYYTMMKNLQCHEWEQQIDLNCKGVLNCIGAVLDGMLKRGKGHIVNMSSDAGRRGFAGLAVYSGTKFFVEGLSQGMRLELASTGVKVTCIQPGDVQTELQSHSTDQEARAAFDGSSKIKILQPQDIGNAVVYATSQPDYCAVNEILIEPREAPI